MEIKAGPLVSDKDQRKHARRRAGLRCRLLRDLPEVELEEFLCGLGLLAELQRDDQSAVTDALQQFVLGVIHRAAAAAATGGNLEFFQRLRSLSTLTVERPK